VDSIIYAPTLSLNAVRNHELTYSMPHAAAMIEALLDAFPERKVIFRPHPNDLQLIRAGRDDALARPFIEAMRLCDSHPRCRLDGSGTFYMDSYNAAAVMISDTSSTAYTYALSTLRPVVFFSPRDEEVMAAMGEDSYFIRDRERIGAVAQSTDEMVGHIRAMLANQADWREAISRYRDEICFNVGRAEEYFVEHVEDILAGRVQPDWRCFNWRAGS
jgi:CDP-glycerol glycerophosphotransferase (TagB/SpsB family)